MPAGCAPVWRFRTSASSSTPPNSTAWAPRTSPPARRCRCAATSSHTLPAAAARIRSGGTSSAASRPSRQAGATAGAQCFGAPADCARCSLSPRRLATWTRWRSLCGGKLADLSRGARLQVRPLHPRLHPRHFVDVAPVGPGGSASRRPRIASAAFRISSRSSTHGRLPYNCWPPRRSRTGRGFVRQHGPTIQTHGLRQALYCGKRWELAARTGTRRAEHHVCEVVFEKFE